MNYPLLPLSLVVMAYLTTITLAFVVPMPVTTRVREASTMQQKHGHQQQKPVSCLVTSTKRSTFSFVSTSASTTSSMYSKYSCRMLSLLFLSKESDESTKEVIDMSDSIANNTTAITKPTTEMEFKTSPVNNIKEGDDMTILKRNLSFGAFKLFSYVIQFLGLYFSFGLLLNILGFGYSFTIENGFQVDTLENIKKERQFEQEMQRIARPKTSMSLSTSMMTIEQNKVLELQDTISPPSSMPK